MNNFYGGYERVVFETPEEKAAKIKRQKRLFSRIFLALFIYAVISQFLSVGVYELAKVFMSKEQFEVFIESRVWSFLIACSTQYLVAFPTLILILVGTDKAVKQKKTKLSFEDFLLLFLIGEAFMFIGGLIGTSINEAIGNLTGEVPINGIESIITKIPVWLVFIFMVLIGPIVEELIFRKIMIDRLSIYGDRTAIVISAIAFGLMHGNLYQFFYAALLGLVFGYVYTLTRDVRYTIGMHMLVNLLGSVVALPVEKALSKFSELMESAALGEEINVFELFTSGSITFAYASMQYGLIIGGIIALSHFIRKKKIRISSYKEVSMSDKDVYKNAFANVGAILFISISVVYMILNLIF